MGGAVTETRTNRTQCEKCGRFFWAWSTGKRMCLHCEPLTVGGTRATLQAIRDGLVRL
jgi:hypothetical protein